MGKSSKYRVGYFLQLVGRLVRRLYKKDFPH